MAAGLALSLVLGPSSFAMPTDADATRIHPHWEAGALQPIPEGIFGDFLEHLGDAVYHTLWADVVYNPAFWHAPGAAPDRWDLLGGAAALSGGDGIQMPAGSAVTESVFLPVRLSAAQRQAGPQLGYRGRLWAYRTSGTPRAAVSIVCGGASAAGCTFPVTSRQGAGTAFRLRVAPGVAVAGMPCQLRVEITGGSCVLRRLELFPDDAVSGMDPDVVQAAKALHISWLRWPGGNFSSGYHWRQGVGPRAGRPTVRNPAWPGLETHAFGTDEFIRFCRIIGAKPMICVNAGDGTPDEAADWVEYCNGSIHTPMGRLRAQNGHPEPYGVKLWEIGNELYGSWQIGHTDAEGNARRFVDFRKAMLARDPTIKVIATGKGDGFVGAGLRADDAWNAALLKAALANGGAPDFLSIHPLVPLPGDLAASGADYDTVYLLAMAHPGWFGSWFVPHLMENMRHAAGDAVPTRLAATEWGIILGGSNWRQFPNHNAQSGAVYAGLFLNELMRCGNAVEVANVTALLHGGGIKKSRGEIYLDPMYFVQQMYSRARPRVLVPFASEGPGYRTEARGFLPGVPFTPWVNVCCAEGKGRLYLFMVNVDPHHPRRVMVDLPRGVAKVSMETLAADPRSGNSAEHPDAVRPARRELAVRGNILDCLLEPCSVNVAEARWRPQGSARGAGTAIP